MGRLRGWASLGLVAWVGVACVSEDAAPSGEQAARQEQPIINGSLDTTRDAVIAILGDQSLCSGTIVQTDPNRGLGWVLTAAHCVDDVPRYIAQGADFNDPDTYYEVVSYEAHPAYDARDTTYDFAVIVFAGADNSTPVIPAVGASDGLREGTQVTSVGYGRTTPSYAQDTGNTRRRRVNRVISDLYQELIVYNISDAGICQGDSGGPVLAQVDGQEQVVGVHSSVSGDCEGEGYSGRVTLVYSSWLVGQLGGEVEPSCELCQQTATSGNGRCVSTIEDCNNSNSCSSLLECLQNCNTDACSQRCADNNPQGLQEYLGIYECICEDACPEECGGTDLCPEPAECGLAFSDEACNSCQEAECCAQAQTCADDQTCLGCLNGTVTEGCTNNRAFNNYYACLEGSCADDCGIEQAECGFSADGECGECLSGACCDEGAECADDEACLACAQGAGEGCESNRKLDAFLGCLATCDGDPCGVEEPSNNANNNTNNANNNTNNSDNNTNNSDNNTNNAGNNDTNNSEGPNNFNNAGNNNSDANNGGSDDNNGGSDDDEDEDGFVGSEGDGDSTSVQLCSLTATQARPASGWPLGAALLSAALGALLVRRRRS